MLEIRIGGEADSALFAIPRLEPERGVAGNLVRELIELEMG
jgi:hypothetical protein